VKVTEINVEAGLPVQAYPAESLLGTMPTVTLPAAAAGGTSNTAPARKDVVAERIVSRQSAVRPRPKRDPGTLYGPRRVDSLPSIKAPGVRVLERADLRRDSQASC
jgi:hypothetical protein